MGANGSRRRSSYQKPKYEFTQARRRWEDQQEYCEASSSVDYVQNGEDTIRPVNMMESGTFYPFIIRT